MGDRAHRGEGRRDRQTMTSADDDAVVAEEAPDEASAEQSSTEQLSPETMSSDERSSTPEPPDDVAEAAPDDIAEDGSATLGEHGADSVVAASARSAPRSRLGFSLAIAGVI